MAARSLDERDARDTRMILIVPSGCGPAACSYTAFPFHEALRHRDTEDDLEEIPRCLGASVVRRSEKRTDTQLPSHLEPVQV